MAVRWHNRAVLIAIGAWLGAAPGFGEVVLDSAPQGSWLQLDGPAFISGSTPLPINVLPQGRYLLRVGGPGVAATRARIHCDANQQIATAHLVPPGSIFFPPGGTHLRSQEYWRSGIFFGWGATGGVALGYAEAARRDASGEVKLAADAYSRAVSEEAIESAWNALVSVSQKESDKTEVRNLWTAYLAGLWVSAAAETRLTPRPRLSRNAAGSYVLDLPRVNTWSAIWRATLISGSGQRYLGRTARSNWTAFTTYGFVAGGLFAYDELLQARRERDDAQRRYDAAMTDSELALRARELESAANKVNDRNTLRWWLFSAAAASHLWGIVDAWQVSAYSKPGRPVKNSSGGSGFSLSIMPDPRGVVGAVAWRLP